MKNYLLSGIAIVSLFLVSSCDKTEAPYKNPIVVPPGERKVLVEDFTGHKCGNCPRASRDLYKLKEDYGDRLIIMAVHAGNFATPFPPSAPYYTYDFRNTVSTTLDTDFGISLAGNPNGMVNRRLVNGSYILSATKWDDEVVNVLSSNEPVPVKITVSPSFNETTRQLTAGVNLEFSTTLTAPHKLCVFMVEDSIVNWQKDYDVTPNDIPDYVHREVLRGSMNGTYGEAIENTAVNDIVNKSYTTTINPEWDAKHMALIVFLYNVTTKEIVQVEQKHIK